METRIRRRFVRRAMRLAHYRRWLAALGLGVVVLGWVATADALVCRYVLNPLTGRWTRICR